MTPTQTKPDETWLLEQLKLFHADMRANEARLDAAKGFNEKLEYQNNFTDINLHYATQILSRFISIQDVKDKVIGEDMPDKGWDEKCPCGATHHYTSTHFKENKLRAEQRQRLDTLVSDRKEG